MAMDYNCPLWPTRDNHFFRDLTLAPLRQNGPHCVATVLAILSRTALESFMGRINTQDPLSWSDSLREFGMKLAYCPSDTRRLKFYLEELVALDDLFTLSYYTAESPEIILVDPDASGWVCGSHLVLLHRDRIIDPAWGEAVRARDHHCSERYTKRLFRVVPADHPRGL